MINARTSAGQGGLGRQRVIYLSRAVKSTSQRGIFCRLRWRLSIRQTLQLHGQAVERRQGRARHGNTGGGGGGGGGGPIGTFVYR